MKYKKPIIVSIVILAIVLIFSALSNSTFALFSNDSYGTNTEYYSTGMLSIVANSKSDNISLTNALPMSDEDGLQTNPYVFTIRNIGNLDYLFDVKLLSVGSSDTVFSSNYIKLQIDDGYVTTLSALTNGVIKSKITLLAGETIDISIRVWLSLETPNSEIGKSFNSKIVTDGQAVYTESNNEYNVSLVNYISKLYNNSDKTEVTAADGITYNYARIYDNDTDPNTSGGLMNDRFGNSNTGINDGNIRYYGANPYNYVDIGDVYEQDITENNWEKYGAPFSNVSECNAFFSDENLINMEMCTDAVSCAAALPQLLQQIGASSVSDVCDVTIIPKGTPKLYRIIGLFNDVELSNGAKKDLIKVIRDKLIGFYIWDHAPSNINDGFGINEWSQADLMKLLNPGYEDEAVGGSLYWNSGTGSCYSYDTTTQTNTSTPCDFTNNGLSKSAQNNIEAVKWNLGGWNRSNLYANDIYGYERGNTVYQIGSNSIYNDTIPRTTLWSGRVALAYPSDYGYAADLGSCSSNLNNYNNCIGTNWMYNPMTAYGNSWSWLLTPYSVGGHSAWIVNGDGGVNFNGVNSSNGVSPVFYLDSELTIESGTGASDDPYVLW